jgi:hypothetical protein
VSGDLQLSTENTGFGLYVLSELARQGGYFRLWSGAHRLTVENDEEPSCTTAASLAGTGIQLRVSTTDADFFPNRLAAIVNQGEAARMPGAVKKEGSSKSRLSGWG